MSIVFEPRHRSFLQDESYPNIDQASDEVGQYDEADDSNVVAAMHDVGDVSELAAAVAASYQPPEQSMLTESEPSRLDVDDVVVGQDGHDGSSDMASAAAATAAAAAAAAASIAAAQAAAERAAAASAASAQPLRTVPLSPSPSQSIKDAGSPSAALPAIPHRVKHIPKPERDVQKNDKGMFQCTWSECEEDVRQFARKCEYNKHMDKHERPYRCSAEGCEKLPGFTYSGGLLRHEREVHGKHGGPRNPLHCPHQTCKRHTGKGFSRQENLNEHLRRVHTAMVPTSTPPTHLSMLGDSPLLNLDVLRTLAAAGAGAGSNGNNSAGAAAAVAAAAASAVAGLPASLLPGDEGNMGPRGRKRTASASILDTDDDGTGLVAAQQLGDYHGHHDLREEVKRVRQENQELRRQVELQKQQTLEMMQQITALQRAAVHQKASAQAQQSVLVSPGPPSSPLATAMEDADELLSR